MKENKNDVSAIKIENFKYSYSSTIFKIKKFQLS